MLTEKDEKLPAKLIPKRVTMWRIMSYYKPKIMAVLSFFASFIVAFTMPIYGYIFSQLLFVMM